MNLIFSILFSLLPFSLASFCGKYSVPYNLEILSDGAPVLGCAQPSCLIHPENFKEDTEFLTDEKGRIDGYFRDGDRGLKRYRNKDAPRFEVNCTGSYEALACSKDQWVGGIEYVDHNRQPLVLHCCSYEGLRLSQDVGMTTIGPGETLTAGEVVRNGRQNSFDVIANVKKVINDGQIFYEVAVKRMNCLPDPPEPEVSLNDGVSREIMKILENKKKEPSHAKKSENNPKIDLVMPDPPESEVSLDDGVSSEILKVFKNKKKEPSHAKETENNPKFMPKPPEPEIPYDDDVPDEILKVIGKHLRTNQAKKSDKKLKHIGKSKKNKQIRKYPPSQLVPESVPTTIKSQKEQAQIEKIFVPNHKIEIPRIIIKKLPNTLLINAKQQAAPVQQVSQNINNAQLEQVQKPIQLPQAYEQVPQQSEPIVQQHVIEPRQSTQENSQQPFGCQEGSNQQAVSLQPNRPCYGVANQEFGHLSPSLPVESTPATILPTLPPHTLPSGFLTLPPHTFPPAFSPLPLHMLLPGFPTLPPGLPTLPTLPPNIFPPFQLIPGLGVTQEPSSGGSAAAFGVPSVSHGSSGAVAFGAPSVSLASGGALPIIAQVEVTPPSVLQPLPIAQPSGTQAQVQSSNSGAPDSLILPELSSLPDLRVIELQLSKQGGSGPAQTAGGFVPLANAAPIYQSKDAINANEYGNVATAAQSLSYGSNPAVPYSGQVLPTAEVYQQQQQLQTYQQPQNFYQSQIFGQAAPSQSSLIQSAPQLGSVTPSPEFAQMQVRQQQAFDNYMKNPFLIGRR